VQLKEQTRSASAVAQPDLHSRLADTYHELLSEHSLGSLLEIIAEAIRELVPYDTLTIYEADEQSRILKPVLARDQWADEIMQTRPRFGEGITGWVVENRQPVLANEAHLDARVTFVPGTPMDPEALISLPLVAQGSVKGALNIYREGDLSFSEDDFALAQRFADVAALALDNAHVREALEHQVQTDPLTGLYNHRFFQERLRSELGRVSRSHDSVALLMFDIDDFKKLNDVHGHLLGDQVLVTVADILRSTIRASDVPCRIGGEEFAVILPSCDAGDALGLARRLRDRMMVTDFEPAGTVTLSMGIAQGPEHAMSPRELVACAEAAMMTAKARGKDQYLLFDEEGSERPDAPLAARTDVRSTAHLKMLQSLAGKLNRLNEVSHIADTIATELRTLIDYHSCRVYLAEGTDLVPAAVRGELMAYQNETPEALMVRFGEGITGRAALTGRSLLIPNALECDFAVQVPGTDEIEESIVAVPMLYGARVNGVLTISKLGLAQFDDDDVRLLEVLGGQASVAFENGRLYEAQRKEAENARSILAFADTLSKAPSFHAIGNLTVEKTVELIGVEQVSLWLRDEKTGDFECAAHHGFVGDKNGLALITSKMTSENADRLIGSRKHPFVVTPDDLHRKWPDSEGVDLPVAAVAPLQAYAGLEGWIAVRQPGEGGIFFTEERLRLLAGLTYQASSAMHKARLYRDQKEAADVASSLLDFSRELSSAENLDDILDRIVELSARILGSPKTSVWMQDPATGDMLCEALWGYGDAERITMMDARVPAVATEAFSEMGEPFVLQFDQYEGMPGVPTFGEKVTFAIAPLRLDGGRSGSIAVGAPAMGDYEFSERKMNLLAGIADQSKLAINNATGFETLETTFLSTVEALANALECKDEYTSSHTRSIVDMSREVALVMGLDATTVKRLEMAALFHDIGKIGIPSHILQKEGPLTDEEWVVMKTHPELGERILAPIERLEDVRPIVRHCHEHYDGSGYPDAKKADAIPIESRVILVCDAFHAMTTDRTYRKRLPVEEAVRRLKESSGRQFDPDVLDVFLGLLNDHPEFACEV
jgi:diguanylate cyclase (GGDEF)-like protein